MIVNLQYFKSFDIVIDIFKPLKKHLVLNEIYHIIEKFEFIYPYFQLIGFALEKLGFKKNELNKFSANIEELKFYTQKNLEKYEFDNYWNIYYSPN